MFLTVHLIRRNASARYLIILIMRIHTDNYVKMKSFFLFPLVFFFSVLSYSDAFAALAFALLSLVLRSEIC